MWNSSGPPFFLGVSLRRGIRRKGEETQEIHRNRGIEKAVYKFHMQVPFAT